MAGLFPPTPENWIEQRVLKFLGENRARPTAKSAGQTEPFEIAVVITDNNQALFGIERGKPAHLDVAIKIPGSESRAPHQIEHGLSEMLVRFANNTSFF